MIIVLDSFMSSCRMVCYYVFLFCMIVNSVYVFKIYKNDFFIYWFIEIGFSEVYGNFIFFFDVFVDF